MNLKKSEVLTKIVEFDREITALLTKLPEALAQLHTNGLATVAGVAHVAATKMWRAMKWSKETLLTVLADAERIAADLGNEINRERIRALLRRRIAKLATVTDWSERNELAQHVDSMIEKSRFDQREQLRWMRAAYKAENARQPYDSFAYIDFEVLASYGFDVINKWWGSDGEGWSKVMILRERPDLGLEREDEDAVDYALNMSGWSTIGDYRTYGRYTRATHIRQIGTGDWVVTKTGGLDV